MINLVQKIREYVTKPNTNLIALTATSAALFISAMLVPLSFRKDFLLSFFKTIYTLTFSPFRVGDRVKINNSEGIVENFDLRFIALKNRKSKNFIPTSIVYNNVLEIIND